MGTEPRHATSHLSPTRCTPPCSPAPRSLDVEAVPDLSPARVGDILHRRADISAAAELLGYEPVMDLDAGLADAMGYYQTRN